MGRPLGTSLDQTCSLLHLRASTAPTNFDPLKHNVYRGRRGNKHANSSSYQLSSTKLQAPPPFTLANPRRKSLLLCAAQGISVFSPHTALDSVKGGINDWLSGIVLAAAPGSVGYVGVPKEEDFGGKGRLVRFQQPVGLVSLVNEIKKGPALTSGTCPTNSHTSAVTHLCHHSKSPT